MGRESKRVGRSMDRTIESAVRRIELRCYQTITIAMPVDTGFARGSVTPSTGSAIAGALDRPKNRAVAKRAGEQAFQANKAKAEFIAGTYKISQGKVFLAIRAPYVRFLNAGSSAQAPKLFIQKAIRTALRSLRPGRRRAS